MPRHPLAELLLLSLCAFLLVFCPACGSSKSPSGPSSTATTVTVVSVTGASPAMAGTSQMTATATLSNNTTKQVTADAAWQSSDTSVATVKAGLVTAVAAGHADITATYQNVDGKLTVNISAATATVTGLSVAGNAPAIGSTSPFTATATLSDSSTQNVTSVAAWQSSNPSVANVSGGVVTGVAAGDTDITATYQGASGTRHITVTTVPPACVFSVWAAFATFPSSGGTARAVVSVLQGTNCGWTARSSDPFLTITSGASGTGYGEVYFTVARNDTGVARSAVVTAAGSSFTVNQAGYCVTSISPTHVDDPAEFRMGTVNVTAPADCSWKPISLSPFIVFDNVVPPYYTGSTLFRYHVNGNLSEPARSGSLQVEGFTLTVTQAARLGGNFLSFTSDQGDYIGQGHTELWEAPTSTFTTTLDASSNHLQIRVIGSDSLETVDWTLNLAAPQGQQLLPGTYLSATRWPFQAPTVPGLDVSGCGRGCNSLSGQFTVMEAVYAVDGTVQRFHATFEQHCDGGPALRGEVLFVR